MESKLFLFPWREGLRNLSMGLTPFSCITLPDCVRVVYPDGHVESLPRSCSVEELLFDNPDYYVCARTPYNAANRLGSAAHLEKGMTYFICASPNAQPFTEPPPKKASYRSSRILPRFARHHRTQGRELRSPVHGSAASRTKVFDFHSATMQQLESIRNSDRPPKHLLRLVFIRHCLHALRLPSFSLEHLIAEPGALSPSLSNANAPAPAPAMSDTDLLPILKSAARCELGLYVSRRQEFYLRRARRRRKVMWKPVLQSISEMSAIVEFNPPVAQQESDSSGSKRFSPPRPDSAVPRKNISPPRQQVFATPAKNVSPPPPPPLQPAASAVKPPGPTRPRTSFSDRSRITNGSYARSLYMA